jgi:hypothetical protein
MAVAGVVLGHWLAYVLAVPNVHLRAEVISASGHSYWLGAVKAAVVLGLTAIGAVVLRHLRCAVRGEPALGERFSSLALRLSVLQVTAFTAMEVIERLAAGAPVSQMLGHHLFLVGVAVQIGVALGGALVLLWLGRAAARIRDAIRTVSLPRPATRASRPRSIDGQPVLALSGAAGVRGPPLA